VTFDPGDKHGRHALDRLERATAAWLTTVTPAGQPQTMQTYSMPIRISLTRGRAIGG
jgi:hypothetical protein